MANLYITKIRLEGQRIMGVLIWTVYLTFLEQSVTVKNKSVDITTKYMSLIRIITQAGPGATVVSILSYLTGKYWFPDLARNELVLTAAVFGFLFGLILKLLSKQAIFFVSFPIIVQAKREIDEKNDQDHFYFDHEDKKDDFDKFDGQVFQYTCLFYSGLLAVAVAGIHAFLLTGSLTTFGLLSIAGLSIVILCVFPVIKIRKIILMTPVMFE